MNRILRGVACQQPWQSKKPQRRTKRNRCADYEFFFQAELATRAKRTGNTCRYACCKIKRQYQPPCPLSPPRFTGEDECAHFSAQRTQEQDV